MYGCYLGAFDEFFFYACVKRRLPRHDGDNDDDDHCPTRESGHGGTRRHVRTRGCLSYYSSSRAFRKWIVYMLGLAAAADRRLVGELI